MNLRPKGRSGRPERIPHNHYGTCTDLLPSTIEHPDAEAVSAENGSRTWRQLETNARRFAHALESLGLGIGDRWALLAHNRVEWPELALGNARAGTRYVPLNWHLAVPELEYLLQDSGATMLIVDPANEEKGRAAALAVGIAPERIFVLGPAFDNWIAGFPDTNPRDDIAGAPLLYTGGTTGRSKGVIRSDTGGPVELWGTAINLWASAVLMPEEGTGLDHHPALSFLRGRGPGIIPGPSPPNGHQNPLRSPRLPGNRRTGRHNFGTGSPHTDHSPGQASPGGMGAV